MIKFRRSFFLGMLLLYSTGLLAQQLRHFSWYYVNTKDSAGQNRRDWFEEADGGWREVYPNGIQGHFTLITKGIHLTIFQNGQQVSTIGCVIGKDDKTLIVFVPDQLVTGQWLQWKAPGPFTDSWGYGGEITVQPFTQEELTATAAPTTDEKKAQDQTADGSETSEDDSDRQEKISELQSDIELQEQSAQNNESSANQVLNNCSGLGAAICEAIGEAGAARFRQKAAEARNKADEDREEIERLRGEEVQSRQRRDTSYGDSLQQVVTENGTSIQNAAAEQQRQLAQAQARSNTQPPAATTTASVSPDSGYNPYNPTSPHGRYNSYRGSASGSIQGSCANMSSWVKGTVKVGTDGWAVGYLTNNSSQVLYVTHTFKKNGVPSNDMADGGGGTIQPGQTAGGELQGLYSVGADKNPAQIYWYAVSESDHENYGCAHKW